MDNQTYLELVNKAIKRSKTSQQQLTAGTFDDALNDPLLIDLKDYVRDAYTDLQLKWRDWSFMQKQGMVILGPAYFVHQRSGVLTPTSVIGVELTGSDTGSTNTALFDVPISGTLAAGTFIGNIAFRTIDEEYKFGEYLDVLPIGGVNAVFITSIGTGYTSAPDVSFSGGGGTGAAATATLNTDTTSIANGQITVTVTDPGSGYTSAPTVSLTGGGGSGATATAVIGRADFLRVVGYGKYSLATFGTQGVISDLWQPRLDTFQIQSTGGDLSDTNDASVDLLPLHYVRWEDWDRFVTPGSSGRLGKPNWFTLDPEGYYQFYPRFDQRYLIKFYYQSDIQELTNDDDTVTNIPAELQDAIVWLAVMYYANLDKKPEIWQAANKRYKFYNELLERYYAPQPGFARGTW